MGFGAHQHGGEFATKRVGACRPARRAKARVPLLDSCRFHQVGNAVSLVVALITVHGVRWRTRGRGAAVAYGVHRRGRRIVVGGALSGEGKAAGHCRPEECLLRLLGHQLLRNAAIALALGHAAAAGKVLLCPVAPRATVAVHAHAATHDTGLFADPLPAKPRFVQAVDALTAVRRQAGPADTACSPALPFAVWDHSSARSSAPGTDGTQGGGGAEVRRRRPLSLMASLIKAPFVMGPF